MGDPRQWLVMMGQQKQGPGGARARVHVQTCARCSLPCPMPSRSSCPGTSTPAQPRSGAGLGSAQSPFPTLCRLRGLNARQQLSSPGAAELALGYFFPSAAAAGAWGWVRKFARSGELCRQLGLGAAEQQGQCAG